MVGEHLWAGSKALVSREGIGICGSPMRKRNFLLAATLAAALSLSGPADAADGSKPQRIVSVNLCADQYLLELADPDQIAGLTRYARDPGMSAAAAKAGNIRLLSSSAEEILEIEPDLIVTFFGLPANMAAGLSGRKYQTLDIGSADSYADIVAQIRRVAKAIGHPARGEALIARMNRDLAAIDSPGRGEVAANYQRRGFLTGTGTLMDDLMRRVGLVNLAGKLDKPALAQLSLEEMMAAQPDYLIISLGGDRVVDQGTEMLQHPVLRHIPRLKLPPAWMVCGSPAYVDAARSLAAQIEQQR